MLMGRGEWVLKEILTRRIKHTIFNKVQKYFQIHIHCDARNVFIFQFIYNNPCSPYTCILHDE